ncbi:chemotaxis protein CheD [Thiovibrio sp. JS02]
MHTSDRDDILPAPHLAAEFWADQPGHLSRLETEPDLPLINLYPGKLLVTNRAVLIGTILGSCVAVCLHSERLQVAAICHSILPRQLKTPLAGNFPYVDTAIAHMLDSLKQRFGLAAQDLTVKLFGGACVLTPVHEGLDDMAIGQRNINAAHESLNRFGLRPSVEKTGGSKGYKILFNTSTGEVFLRYLVPRAAKNLAGTIKRTHLQ